MDFEEGRLEVFGRMIQETEKVRTRILETVRDEEKRSMGLVACTKLIHQYKCAVKDWSKTSKQLLSEAEEDYMEMQDIVFSE